MTVYFSTLFYMDSSVLELVKKKYPMVVSVVSVGIWKLKREKKKFKIGKILRLIFGFDWESPFCFLKKIKGGKPRPNFKKRVSITLSVKLK